MSWAIDPLVLAGVLAAGTAYVWAEGRARTTRRPRRQTLSGRRWFFAGLAVILIALDGPIDGAATSSFSDHMLQHLLLTMVAAPLLILGAPITLALHAAGPRSRHAIGSALGSLPMRVLGNPIVTWSLFFLVIWGAHMSNLYEAALRDPTTHAFEHVAFLAAALVFWMPVVAADPAPGRLTHPARILYLFLAMPAMAFLGLTLASTTHVLYPTYAQVEATAAALADQQLAGAIMWGGSMVVIVPILGAVLLDWMRADEREARRIDARLARTASPTGGEP